jgi:hypothetical protein
VAGDNELISSQSLTSPSLGNGGKERKRKRKEGRKEGKKEGRKEGREQLPQNGVHCIEDS